ncbi:MAG: hypothetical protein H7331_10520 [Bacteroidia bacterium]|nr:hypothetical protein [Bacteroidia bacterium]
MMLILRLRSVTSLTLARANQFNNKLWNTCGNGAITNEAQKVFIETSVELKIEAVKEGVEKISEKKSE